jgi:hypothetical protein
MSGKLVPNSFQHPNVLIDRLAYFLTPEENVVLTKAVREILGWSNKIESRRARIALSVFVKGKFDSGKNRLCYGCGLGIATVRKVLKSLDDFNILVKVGDATSDGQEFYLQEDTDAIEWKALILRRETWDTQNARRTKKARGVLSDSRGVTSQQGVLSDRRGEVLSDNRGGVLSDSNKETHEETHEETQDAPSAPPVESPNETLDPDTPKARILFARLQANARAKRRRGPKRFPSLESKRKFLKTCERLDGQFDAALNRALEKGIVSIVGIVDFMAKWNTNGGGAHAGNKPSHKRGTRKGQWSAEEIAAANQRAATELGETG